MKGIIKMNTDKTAELISRRRKMKNLTQKELAMQLGVTDKAVSKWERGLNFPYITYSALFLAAAITLCLGYIRTNTAGDH